MHWAQCCWKKQEGVNLQCHKIDQLGLSRYFIFIYLLQCDNYLHLDYVQARPVVDQKIY